MNASYEWLKELVPSKLTPTEVADLFTERCASVDEIVNMRADLAGIVIGRVVKAGRHPNSDHLWVTKVDAGGGDLLDVVCGAPNVKEGALYPFAPVGTTLPGGLKLEKRKIRGETSNGMLCSARELGLGEDHAGILELDIEVATGTPFLSAVPVGDHCIVVDVTPNRPDLLSHIGLARELSAAISIPLKLPDAKPEGWREPVKAGASGTSAGVRVEIVDEEGCSRYVGAIIKGVTIRESPEWLRRRLEAIGSRPVNNIVDVTNYILHESGQPLHAFDRDKLGGNAVVIRRAHEGEILITLDGVERKLSASMTVIADAERAHAIAGVMGGEESAVSADTRTVFLEIATFNPARIRATRLALGMSTDASYRFERGVDPELPAKVVARAAQMIIDLAGGELADVATDVHPRKSERTRLTLRLSRVVTVLGEEFSAETVAKYLASVGFEVDVTSTTEVRVTVPSWRVDVAAEIDLVEEVARLHGYANFSDSIRAYRPGTVPDDASHLLSRQLRSLLAGRGLLEARPLPFVRGDDATHVAIANPISEDERHLRRSILETLARRAEFNLAQMQRSVRLFEIGNVFARDGGSNGMPREALHVGVVLLGERIPAHFTAPRPPHYDEWDAKGVAEELGHGVYPGASIRLVEQGDSSGLLWEIFVDDAKKGEVRRINLDAPVWAAPAYGVELHIADLSAVPVAPRGQHAHGESVTRSSENRLHKRFRAIPVHPAASFDVALVAPDSLAASRIEEVIRKTSGELLESVELFDEFRGGDVPSGNRSLGWRLTFRHFERTLRDKEVEGRRQKLLTVLEKELGVRQRSS